MLEPYDGKLSRTVLRGERGRNPSDLLVKQSHTFVFINFLYDKLGKIVVSNKQSDFEAFLEEAQQFLQPQTEFQFGFEDTTHYGRHLATFLINKGYSVRHVNAHHVTAERNSRNILQKTDEIDAECAARVLIHRFEGLPLARNDERFFTIKMLTSKRRSALKTKRSLMHQLHNIIFMHYPSYHRFFSKIDGKSSVAFYQTFPTPHTLKNTTLDELTTFFETFVPKTTAFKKASIILTSVQNDGVTESTYQANTDFIIQLIASELQKTIEEIEIIENQLAEFLNHFNTPLLSMKGIDVVTAAGFIAEIGDITRFKNAAALARYAGIAPVTRASGNSDVKYASKQGNRQLNSLFFSLALSLTSPVGNTNLVLNPFFYDFYNRKRAEGKTVKQALKSVSRRLVNIIYGMMKYGEDYLNPPTVYVDLDTGVILDSDGYDKLNENQKIHIDKRISTIKPLA